MVAWLIPAAMAASAIIGGGATLGGGMMANSAREEQANQANQWGLWMQQGAQQHQNEMANFNARFNAEQAATARDWSERMSNTSWQRGMADMRAAGMNPILAYSQGGASGGQAASASTSNSGGATSGPGAKADVQDAIGPAVSSALHAAHTVQGLQTAQEQISQTQANTDLQRVQAAREQATIANLNAQTVTEGHRAGLVNNQAAHAAMLPALAQAQTAANSASAAYSMEGTRGSRLRNDDYENSGPEGGLRDTFVRGERMGRRAAANAPSAAAVGSAANSARDAAGRIRESITVMPRASDDTMEGLNNQWRDLFRGLWQAIR